MKAVEGDLSFSLHVLTARLERAADRILRAEYNVTPPAVEPHRQRQAAGGLRPGRTRRKVAAYVAHSGVPYIEYAAQTQRLLATLDRLEQEGAK